ncbi:MAG: hypothetical protein WCC69_03235 [Pirellulales bacterium]
MAGSFEIFRKYQRSLLVFVAILAMLAFFVLPPFLQMGAGGAGSDPVVASWSGGEIRESDMMRGVAMRTVLNQFLLDAVAASGRDPGRMRLLPDDEEDVVRTMLLAKEAEANGVVVSNAAINQFLGEWTNNMVRPEQFDAIIARRRGGPMAVSQGDVFEALRTVLAAGRMERLFLTGFAGDPPAQRWDYFRRLEQGATVEVVPVAVESLVEAVSLPSEATLLNFFDQYKDDLPAARSASPGFKEPHRISAEYLVAKREVIEAEVRKEVTDEQVKKFYEENRERLYRVKAAEPAAPAAEEKPAAAGEKTGEKTAEPAPPAEPKAVEPAKAAEPKAAVPSRLRVLPAAFRQPGGKAKSAPATAEAKPADVKPAAEQPKADAQADAVKAADAEKKGDTAKDAAKKDEAAFEPLEKVADDVRNRLASEAAAKRIDAVFTAVTTDFARYAEDLALWQAQVAGAGGRPQPPNVEAIAKKQGLESGRLERVSAGDAVAAGGLGTSFELSLDQNSPMGFRQVSWDEMVFAPTASLWRPAGTRDVAGNRYLSWKTEDQPAFSPTFDKAKADVERAWKIVEGRPLARKLAEELAKQAGYGKTLEAAVAARTEGPKLAAATVGPFTWMSRAGTFGAAPTLSQPDGLSMPGEEFMKAVFALEPGQTAVAFNDPRTVCYAIRLVSYEPDQEKLREQFVDPGFDQRRIAVLARQQEGDAIGRWIEDVQRRYALQWKRPPRR